MKLLAFPKTNLNTTTRLFDELTTLPEFSMLSDIDNLVICNIDSSSLHSLYNNESFYDANFGLDKFKLFIVHELDKDSIPFLKCADLLVFLTKNQQRKFNKLVKINIPSVCIPYPVTHAELTPKSNAMAFLADFNIEHINDYIQFVKTWAKKSQKSTFKIYDIANNNIKSLKNTTVESLPEHLTAVFTIDNAHKSQFDDFIISFKKYASDAFESVNIIDASSYNDISLDDILSTSGYSYIFNKELSQNKFNMLVRNNDTRLIYTKFTDNYLLSKSISHNCKLIIADGISTAEKINRPTHLKFIQNLIDSINKYKNTRQKILTNLVDNLPIDHIYDLNILWEHTNIKDVKYAFIVNFRNQATKIIRCLHSINHFIKNTKCAVIVTDDNSDDGSCEIVYEYIKSQPNAPFVFISNKDRKYASRNLFNAIANFINNPETIIIDIDGDDYLNTDYPILDMLDTEYNAGALTTHGQLLSYPQDFSGMERYNNVFDTKNQWNQNKCASWLPLRTYKAGLFNRVDLLYFIDMELGGWLRSAHDVSINSRMLELSNNKIGFIKEPIYIYDCSGYNHDAIVEEWSPLPSYRKLYHVITY